MKPSLLPLFLFPLAACAATADGAELRTAPVDPAPSAPSEVTLARFERLKELAGDWYEVDAAGEPTGEIVLNYRVSSGGSAVIETCFPWEPHEMLTAYTLDGGDLVLTHYCALGNAPRMRAVAGGDGSEVHFECDGVGNVASHDELHMHDAVFRFEGDGRLRSVWTLWSEGQLGGAEAFELVRG